MDIKTYKENDKSFLSLENDDDDELENLLEYNGIGIMPIEGIVAIKGKAKQGKTQAICILIAAVLGDKSFGFTSTNFAKNSIVLYIDTEQSRTRTKKIYRRVHALLDWDEKLDNDRFLVTNIKKESPEEKAAHIERIISDIRPTLVVIDGIADLVSDINNSHESASCLQSLIRYSEDYHCCIMAVLHENKGIDDKAMRGHLGTSLLFKADDVFAIKLTSKTYCMTHEISRGEPIEQEIKWHLEEGKLIPMQTVQLISKDAVEEQQTRELFNKILKPNQPMYREDVFQEFCKISGNKGKSFEGQITIALRYGIITKKMDGRKAIFQLNSTNYNF